MITLEQALGPPDPFGATVGPEGGWPIRFPDRPGCTAYAESFDENGPMARASFEIWLRSASERSQISEPTIDLGPGWPAAAVDISGSDAQDGAAARATSAKRLPRSA